MHPYLVNTRRQAEKPKKAADYSVEQKQEFYSGLVYIGRDRGYQPGWAKNKYREKFGVWPQGMFDIPRPPTEDVWRFERAARIRYVKAREARERPL